MTLGSLLLILFIPLLFNLCTAWIWIEIGIRKEDYMICRCWRETFIYELSIMSFIITSFILILLILITAINFLVVNANMILW